LSARESTNKMNLPKAKRQSKTQWAEMFYGCRKQDRKGQKESSWETKFNGVRKVLSDERSRDAVRLLTKLEYVERKEILDYFWSLL
jgi:hypothetical protein